MLYSANTNFFFKNMDFEEQLKNIKKHGLCYIEILFPYLIGLENVKRCAEQAELSISLIDVLAGDVENGDLSAAINPKRSEEFKRNADEAVRYADRLNVRKINCLAGRMDQVESHDREESMNQYMKNLEYLCKLNTDIEILIEPISDFQFQTYLIDNLKEADQVRRELNNPNLQLQFDAFHVARRTGNVIDSFKRFKNNISYVQIANPPGRHEPGCGELDYSWILKQMKKEGYDGFIGLEYIPFEDSASSLEWIKKQDK